MDKQLVKGLVQRALDEGYAEREIQKITLREFSVISSYCQRKGTRAQTTGDVVSNYAILQIIRRQE